MKMADPQQSRLACFEQWGGNRKAEFPVELPGLLGWVCSLPLEADEGGGDVHYLSVCSKGMVSRIALADVSGHGPSANAVAERLRGLLRAHTDSWDQTVLMRELSDAFHEGQIRGQFATATVLGFYVETSELLFTNAGHPPPLWFRAKEKAWHFLKEDTRFAEDVDNLPLGLIQGTSYSQTAVRLDANDLLVLYTDGVTETLNDAGQELGREGLLDLARQMKADGPAELSKALLAGLLNYRGAACRRDDETVVVLQRQMSQ